MRHEKIDSTSDWSAESRLLKIFTLLAFVFGSGSGVAQTVEPTGSDERARTVLPPDQAEAGRRNVESIRTNGFVEMLDEQRRVGAILEGIESREAQAVTVGRSNDSAYLGFMELDKDSYYDFSRAPFSPAVLNERYLTPESKSYMLDGGSETMQLHTNTKFGALLIEESRNTSSRGGAEPNTFIDGNPAIIVHIKYDRDQWATAVYVQNGTSFFAVETDRRVAEPEIPGYLRMVEEFVVAARNKRM